MSILTEVFQLCHPKCPQSVRAANRSGGCVLGGKFSLATLLPRIDIKQILLITNISSETVSQTAKRFTAYSPLRLAHVQKHIHANKSDEKVFFYTKYILQKCPIFMKIYVLIFQEEEMVDTCHSAEWAVVKAQGAVKNTNGATWHNTAAVNKFTLKDLLLLTSL